MKAKRRSKRARTASSPLNGSAKRYTRRPRRRTSTAYDLWREQARPAIRQAARDWQASPVFDVAEEIRVEVQEQVRRLIPDIVIREVRGVLDDVTQPNRRRRTRTA